MDDRLSGSYKIFVQFQVQGWSLGLVDQGEVCSASCGALKSLRSPSPSAEVRAREGVLLYYVFGFGDGSPCTISASLISWGSKNPPLMTQPLSPTRGLSVAATCPLFIGLSKFWKTSAFAVGSVGFPTHRVDPDQPFDDSKSISVLHRMDALCEWEFLSQRYSQPTTTACWVALATTLPSSILSLLIRALKRHVKTG